MDYKHLKAIGKRFLALMLSMVMVFSGTVTYAEPAESEKTDAIDDKALKEALEAESDTYPDGAFEFFLSQLEGTEGDPQMELTIVRRGGNGTEASVDFKAVGISAAYGEDYTLSVDESMFTKRVLESTADNETLTEDYGQNAVTAEASTEEADTEGSTEASTEKSTEASTEGSTEASTEKSTEASTEESTEASTEGSTEASTEESTEASTEESTEASTEESTEASTEESTEASTEKSTEAKRVQLTDASQKKSSLQAAKDTYLQQDSNPVNWTELDEESKAQAEKQFAENEAAMEEFAQNIPGASYTFDFAPGEYKKTVYIDIIDDTVSETDEQVMFLLSNAVNGELAGSTTAYLNIKDNDEDEKTIFAMADSEITVDAAAETAKVIVKRVSGVEKIASVVVGTGAVSAQPGVDYEAVNTEVLFTQGMTEQVVEIPLKHRDVAETLSFQVALDPETVLVQEGAAITTVNILPSQENKTETIEVSKELNAATNEINDTRTFKDWWVSVNRGMDCYSGRKRLLSDIDLSTADYITVTWKADWGSNVTTRTYKDGCDEKQETITYSDRDAYLYVNGQQGAAKYNNTFGWTDTRINLSDAMQTTNAYIDAEVKTKNNNNQASIDISKVVIHYPGYTFTVANTPYVSGNYSNQYVEKIYTESGNKKDSDGHRYKDGTRFTIGTIQVTKNGANNFGDSVVLHKSSDSINFKHTYDTNANGNGVRIKEGNDGNVYIVGYQLQKNGSSSTWSEVIKPDDFKFSKAFIQKYKNYLGSGNVFLVRPVYRPFTTNVAFQNSDSKKGNYNNSFKNNSVLRCTQLDTIELNGIAVKGYSVEGFSLAAHQDGWLHQSGISANLLSERGENFYNQNASFIKSETQRISSSRYQKVAVANAKWFKTISNKITFTPDKEYVFLNMTYTTPKIRVKIDPNNNNKDKGAVVYTPGADEEVDKTSVLNGSKDQELVVSGVTLNQEYTFNAVTEDGYKAYWKNFTGDDNEDGRITTAEEKLVSQYSIVRTANDGNAYTFRPQLANSLIYYGFNPVSENRYPGFIDGVVTLKTKPVFSEKETLVAVNGAQVSVAGKTVGTSSNAKYGGVKENGGDGYFSISDKDFTSGENVTVNISYNNVSLSATQAVNAAAIYTLDAYDTIRVSNAAAYRLEDQNTAVKINAADMASGDIKYRIAIDTYSTNDAISAKKAVFRFYRKDGSYINAADQTVTTDNGSFTLDFNPKTLSIPTGASMTVQFYDQNDVGYFEHELGFNFAQSLGMVSFLSSFNFGGAEKALEIIGTIDSAFNFGWDGNIDQESDNVIISDDRSTKTLTLGFDFAYEAETDDKDDESDKKTGSDAAKKEAVKDAAKNAGVSKQQKEAQKKAAEDAIDSGSKKNKSSAKVGASGSVAVSFSLGVTMCKSEDPDHLSEWYFKDMMLCVKAEGGVNVKASYVTPIGIPVVAALSVGASGSATFIIEQNYLKKEYYFSDVKDTTTSKIDLFNFNMNNKDRAFDAYGIFTIAPYIDLSAGVGFDFLELSIGGRADFDMNFYTDSGISNTGSVNLSAYVRLKVLFFTKQFNIASHNFSLFGNAVDSTGALASLGEEDYRYAGLDTLEVDDRGYLANRTEWNSTAADSIDQVGSIADVSGVKETVLLNGAYPDMDTQILEISKGKYLAVFISDDVDRNEWNGKSLFYTIYSEENDRWSVPALIEDDNTLDEAPAMFDVGDKIYIAWSTADRAFTEKPGTLEALNSMNIHGVFFDKETYQFGKIDKITETAPFHYETEDGDIMADNTADVDPHISYDKAANKMLIYYTKSEYASSSTEEDGVIGDAVNPYSVIAYRIYDMKTGKWQSTYDASEGVTQDYEKTWYGQRFLDLAPLASITEKLDDDGYWAEDPVISAYQPKTLEDGTIVDPIVIESDAITYNGLSLFTYVMDYDGNKETINDRDIFLQIYNYAENSFTYPIMITNDTASESNIRLAHGCNATILAYISDGTLKAINISQLVRSRLIKTEVNGKELYYINRSAPSDTDAEDAGVYEPVMTVAGKDASYVQSSEDDTEEQAEQTDDGSIAAFDFVAADNYIYAIWTQNKTVVKEGIDPNSEEAQDAKNRIAEAQLYTVRFDNANNVVTDPVQITEEAGANFDNIAFAVKEDGTIKALATKAPSKVETTKSDDGVEISYPVADEDNKTFLALDFSPKGSLAVEDVSVEELMAGVASSVNIDLYNDGLETLDGLTFTAVDEDGKELYSAPITTGESETKIFGGRSVHINFPITPAEDAAKCAFKYTVMDADKNVLIEDSFEQEIPLVVDVTEFTADLTDRNTIVFNVGVQNNGARNSGVQTINIAKSGKKGKQLLAIQTESLKPGDTVYYEREITFADYEDMFSTYIDVDSESYEAITTFTAETGIGNGASTEIELTATKEQRLRMESIKNIQILDDADNQITDQGFKIATGEVRQLQTAIKSVPYGGSRYEGMDDETNKDNANGLRVLYQTDNEDVVSIYDSGYIEGLKKGTATITAYILPENNHVTYSQEDGTLVEDNFTTIPEEAIKTKTIIVNVGGAKEVPVTPEVKAKEATGITLNQTKASIAVRNSILLAAKVSPDDATDKTVTWSSSDPSVATVTDGKVTGLKGGTAVITAETANHIKATCQITVNSVKFAKSSVNIGLKEKYVIKPVLSKGSTDKLSKVKVSSSNKKIATVKKAAGGKLKITGKKKGSAKITVTTTSGAKAVLKVTVKKAPKSIKAKRAQYEVKKGKSKKIAYSLSKGSASGKITFKSANKKIAAVDENGKITGKKKGKTKITLKTYNGKKATVKVVVK